MEPADSETASPTPGPSILPPEQRRGRGSASNRSGRFEALQRHPCEDDGWRSFDDPPPTLKTSVTLDKSLTIIARNKSPDLYFSQSINPYRGCEHGCIYCFARPSHAYLGLSPGIDFESKLFAKPDAARLLRHELSAPSYRPAVIALGTNTDPYQPIDRNYKLMRQILEVLHACNHPVGIVTKSALVMRDIDLLSEMAKKNLVGVGISVTTLDRKLARAMEPRAATPARRLDAIEALSRAGIPVRLMLAPVIPGLTDWEMERILAAGASAGARSASYILLRLPLEIKDLFREWLEENVPDRAKRVIGLMQQMHGGKDYDAAFGRRMTGHGTMATLLKQRFRLTTARLGLNGPTTPLDTSQFVKPDRDGQLRLL